MNELIKVEKLNYKAVKSMISIPDFQRTLVWNRNKKQDLIRSILKNCPIGAITLFKGETEDDILLIDGLQRITTINEFNNKPSKIFSWNQLVKNFNEEINDLISDDLKDKEKEILNECKKWYMMDYYNSKKSVLAFMRNTDIQKYIKDEYVCEKFITSFIDLLDLEKIEIALIIYKGPKDNVADIFEKTNSGSVRLSKYEFYAAAWEKYYLTDLSVCDLEWLNIYLELHYNDIKDLFVEDSSQEFKIRNIFQLLLSLSNYIMSINEDKNMGVSRTRLKETITIEKADGVEVKKEMSRDEIAFELLSLIRGYSVNQVHKVVEDIIDVENESNNIEIADIEIKRIINEFNVIKEVIDNIIKEKLFTEEHSVTYHSYFIIVCSFYLRSGYFYNNNERVEFLLDNSREDELFNFIYNIEVAIKESWFRGDNRQVSFLSQSILYFKELINNNLKPTYELEDSEK